MTGTLYVLVKPDGTRSSPAEYSAISRLAGHLGGTIEPARCYCDELHPRADTLTAFECAVCRRERRRNRPAPDFDARIDYPERYADGRPI